MPSFPYNALHVQVPFAPATFRAYCRLPDLIGNLQLVQREIEETKKTGKDLEETKTRVMLPSVNGGLAPAMQMQERRKRGANDTIESQKTTLLPDGAGKWQVGEIRQTTTRQEGKNRSSEERISRPDSEGKLGEVSRTVSNESESASGEKRNTVETYSVDVPGSARDSSLHLFERATTARTSSTGQQTTEQQVEQPNPGDPGSTLRVTTLTTDAVRPRPFRSAGHANRSSARRERKFWSSLRGHHKVRQHSRHPGSDRAF